MSACAGCLGLSMKQYIFYVCMYWIGDAEYRKWNKGTNGQANAAWYIIPTPVRHCSSPPCIFSILMQPCTDLCRKKGLFC